MQLSVSTPSTDSTLAAFLLAGASPATATPEGGVSTRVGFAAVLDGTESCAEGEDGAAVDSLISAAPEGSIALAIPPATWAFATAVAQPLVENVPSATSSQVSTDTATEPGTSNSMAEPSSRSLMSENQVGKEAGSLPNRNATGSARTSRAVSGANVIVSAEHVAEAKPSLPTPMEFVPAPHARAIGAVEHEKGSSGSETTGNRSASVDARANETGGRFGSDGRSAQTSPMSFSRESVRTSTVEAEAVSLPASAARRDDGSLGARMELASSFPAGVTPSLASASEAVARQARVSHPDVGALGARMESAGSFSREGVAQSIAPMIEAALAQARVSRSDDSGERPLAARTESIGTAGLLEAPSIFSARVNSAHPFSGASNSALSAWPLTAGSEERPLSSSGSGSPFTPQTITSPHQLGTRTALETRATVEVTSPSLRPNLGDESFAPTVSLPVAPSALPTPFSTAGASSSVVIAGATENRAEPANVSNFPVQAAASASTPTSVVTHPLAATELRARPTGEKIAAEASLTLETGDERTVKNFVSTGSKRVTSHDEAFGTRVAKPLDAMLSAATLTPSAAAHHESVEQAAAPTATEVSFDLSMETDVTPETINTAHRAVEAVLTAVHRFASKDHQAVNLQFTVGGSDLSVRVEMRADEVRATFTTDSAELRAALAHEWHSAQPPSSDRPLRLAAPTFASNDAAHTGSSAGENFSRQRDPGAHTDAAPFSFVAPRGRSARGATSDSVSAASVPRIPHRTSLHLHTLA